MKIGITQLIAENIAPPNAKNIAIYKGDTKICDVDISKMKPTNLGNKLYSFGLVSDMHLDGVGNNGTYLSNAMTFFENQGCAFCCHAGDITNIGFWYYSEAENPNREIYYTQMADFKSVIDAHPNLPMYGICGNHESYNKSIMDNLTELKQYTYRDLYYTYEHRNDLFVFIGQPSGTIYAFGKKEVWEEELAWLETTLEANKDKRCFVFVHPPLNDDSGNPNNVHGESNWLSLEETLVNIMKQYQNAILVHGHSHLDFNEQFNWTYSNYSTRKGFKSLHVPSSSACRVTVNGEVQSNDSTKRYGYIVDVYENHIVLNGYDLVSSKLVPIAQYCIQV